MTEQIVITKDDKILQEIERLSTRVIIFSEDKHVHYSYPETFKSNEQEITEFLKLFESSQNSLVNGVVIDGTNYEVFRSFDSLVTGRHGNETDGEGFSIIKELSSKTGSNIYILITFKVPTLSSRVTPLLQNYCQQFK
eukprot:gene6683-8268_t